MKISLAKNVILRPRCVLFVSFLEKSFWQVAEVWATYGKEGLFIVKNRRVFNISYQYKVETKCQNLLRNITSL